MSSKNETCCGSSELKQVSRIWLGFRLSGDDWVNKGRVPDVGVTRFTLSATAGKKVRVCKYARVQQRLPPIMNSIGKLESEEWRKPKARRK